MVVAVAAVAVAAVAIAGKENDGLRRRSDTFVGVNKDPVRNLWFQMYSLLHPYTHSTIPSRRHQSQYNCALDLAYPVPRLNSDYISDSPTCVLPTPSVPVIARWCWRVHVSRKWRDQTVLSCIPHQPHPLNISGFYARVNPSILYYDTPVSVVVACTLSSACQRSKKKSFSRVELVGKTKRCTRTLPASRWKAGNTPEGLLCPSGYSRPLIPFKLNIIWPIDCGDPDS